MKVPLCFIFVLICHLVCYAIKPSSAFYEALSKGARTRMVCHIADERGSPVVNANVRVVLAKNDSEYSLFGVTDTNGVYVIEGMTTGNYIQLSVDKKDYYSSWKRWGFIDMGNEHDVKDGKWQPYDSDEYIALRRILCHKSLVVFNKIIDMPSTNVWIGFDMKKQSFVCPHGIGEESDFEVYVEWDGLPAWESKYCNAKIRFASPFCGGYYVANVSESRFPYPYRAEMPNTFQEKDVSIVDRAGDPHQTKVPFRKDACMVTRTRSVIDENGTIKSANYGSIRRFEIGPSKRGVALLRLYYVFNPTPNDTNLEAK